jgi:hypothetical protein
MPQIAARERIDEEHAAMRALLDRIEQTSVPDRLVVELERLDALLDAHFAGEEADDGLHEAIGSTAPHLLPAVQHLFDEHRVFRADIGSIAADARRLAEGPLAELNRRVADLAARLRAHEEREDELFGDSVYTDLGGRG